MNGALCHKGTNPTTFSGKALAGLFGANGAGRHNRVNGWKEPRCIYWLFLHKFGEKNAKDAMTFLEEKKKDLAAYADDYEYATWFCKQDILYLRLR